MSKPAESIQLLAWAIETTTEAVNTLHGAIQLSHRAGTLAQAGKRPDWEQAIAHRMDKMNAAIAETIALVNTLVLPTPPSAPAAPSEDQTR